MNLENKKITLNNLSISSSLLSSNPLKIKSTIKTKGMLSKFKLSSTKENDLYNNKNNNNNEIDKEEFGYELNQSSENNLSFNKDEKEKKIITKINKNGIFTSFDTSNNNCLVNNNTHNDEIDNEWNNPKINFDGISNISKAISTDGNLSEYVITANNNNNLKYYCNDQNMLNNIMNNNNLNNEQKKQKNNIILSNNNQIENPSLINKKNDLNIKYNNYILENKKIKKSLILQQILLNEMKKEIENLKIEKTKIQNEFNIEKKNTKKEYENKLKNIIKEKDKLIDIIKNQKKEINIINKLNNEKKDEIEKLSKNIEKINDKNKNLNIEKEEEKFINDENYKNILTEKINIIKELQNKNLDLIKEKDILNLKIIQLSDKKQKELNNKNQQNLNISNFIELIDNIYETFKKISINIKNFYTNFSINDNNKIIFKNLKDYIDNINFDNNENISLMDKLVNINDFNNIMKSEIDLLLKYFKNIIIDNKNIINNNNDINNNLFNFENGQNNIINNNSINYKKYLNANLFKKISIKNNNFKNKKNYASFSTTNISENNKMFFRNNSNTNINNYKNINENNDEIINFHNNGKMYNNSIYLKNNLLEKNSVVYKSNLYPFNEEHSLNKSINDNNKFKLNYNKIIYKILKGKERKYININFNSKVKEVSDLIKNKGSNKLITANKLLTGEFSKNYRKLKLPRLKDFNVNNSINLYPSISDKSGNISSLSNNISNRNHVDSQILRPIYKHSSGINSFKNQNFTFENNPTISNYKAINNKKYSFSFNNHTNKNAGNRFEEFDYIKTESKNNKEYLKIKNLFQKLSNSFLNITTDSNDPISNTEITPIKIGSKSFSSLDKNKILKIHSNDNRKLFTKISLDKHKLKGKNSYNINGLTNDVMKPSFLKSNAILTLNNIKSEKGKILNKDIKKNNYSFTQKINKKE